jgi:DNA-directed RNA polymerase subunit RPC12/RpoP
MKKIDKKTLELAKKGEIVVCEKCGSDYWYPIFVLSKISKLETGLSKDKIIPLQAFRCANCGHINRDFNPLEDN